MGRGLGRTQRAILAALAGTDDPWLTVTELAGRLDRGPRQVRAAVRALEQRGLVVVERGHTGWHGAGEYGRLARREWNKDLPVVLTVHAGDRWPGSRYYRADPDAEFVRIGMPASGLLVWLPERRQQEENELAARRAQWRDAFSGKLTP